MLTIIIDTRRIEVNKTNENARLVSRLVSNYPGISHFYLKQDDKTNLLFAQMEKNKTGIFTC